MENTEIKYIIAIEEFGNITKAAEKLYISQPALSKYLRETEEKIGGKLFDRLRNNMIPTELGRLYLRYAHQIQLLELQCNDELRALLEQSAHTLSLGLPSSRSRYFAEEIMELKKNNPDYEFHTVTDHSDMIEHMAENGQLDLAFINSDAKLNAKLIQTESFHVYIPAETAKRLNITSKEINLSSLLNETFYISDNSNVVGRTLEKALQSEHISLVHTKRFDDSQLSIQMAVLESKLAFLILSEPNSYNDPLINQIRSDLYLVKDAPCNYFYLKKFTDKAKNVQL